MKIPVTINKAPTGYYARLLSQWTTNPLEIEEVKQFHGHIAEWKLTVVSAGGETFGVTQGKDYNDALNSLILTSRDVTSDPDYLAIKVSATTAKVLFECWYHEDE